MDRMTILPLALRHGALALGIPTIVLGTLTVPFLQHAGVRGLDLGAGLAIFVFAIVSSVAGFAFAAVSGVYLFRTGDSPVHVVQTIVICSIAIQAVSFAALVRSLRIAPILRLTAGGLVGLPAGLYLLYHVPAAMYTRTMGVCLVAYAVYRLANRATPNIRIDGTLARALDVTAGVLGGITGGFAGFPGALVTIWCGLRGWDKIQQRATFSAFILTMQLCTLAIMAIVAHLSGTRGASFDPAALAYVPGALAGTAVGLRLFYRLTMLQFERVVLALLIASGLGMAV
jgi:uncharacterized membrane protein YfcA